MCYCCFAPLLVRHQENPEDAKSIASGLFLKEDCLDLCLHNGGVRNFAGMLGFHQLFAQLELKNLFAGAGPRDGILLLFASVLFGLIFMFLSPIPLRCLSVDCYVAGKCKLFHRPKLWSSLSEATLKQAAGGDWKKKLQYLKVKLPGAGSAA